MKCAGCNNRFSVRADGKGRHFYCSKRCANRARSKKQIASQYGLSLEQYNQMFVDQNGLCACCGEPESAIRAGKIKRLAVDHDHSCCPGRTSCGKCVRGLLCQRCNIMIGIARESADYVEQVALYLRYI